MKIIYTLLLALPLFQISMGGGRISIMLTKYDNSEGKDDDGNCCESFVSSSNCEDVCNHYFIICLNHRGGPFNEEEDCPLGKQQTGIIEQNVITFNKFIGDTPNPMNFHFDNHPGSFNFKVQVWDDDNGPDDFIDSFSEYITANKDWKHFVASRKTQLEFNVSISCDENWCGQYCNKKITDDICDERESTDTGNQSGYHTKETSTHETPNDNRDHNIRNTSSHQDPNENITYQPMGNHMKETSSHATLDDNVADQRKYDSKRSTIAAISGIIVFIAVMLCFLVIVWRRYRKNLNHHPEQQGQNNSLNGDEDDVQVYYTAHAVFAEEIEEVGDNHRNSAIENDVHLMDNLMYDGFAEVTQGLSSNETHSGYNNVETQDDNRNADGNTETDVYENIDRNAIETHVYEDAVIFRGNSELY